MFSEPAVPLTKKKTSVPTEVLTKADPSPPPANTTELVVLALLGTGCVKGEFPLPPPPPVEEIVTVSPVAETDTFDPP